MYGGLPEQGTLDGARDRRFHSSPGERRWSDLPLVLGLVRDQSCRSVDAPASVCQARPHLSSRAPRWDQFNGGIIIVSPPPRAMMYLQLSSRWCA